MWTTTLATLRWTNSSPGQQADDLVGRDAAVRAANPEVFGRLLRGQGRKEPGIALPDSLGPFTVVLKETRESGHVGIKYYGKTVARLLLCRLLMRTLGALVAVLGLTVAGWVYLAQPVESASTLNAKSGSPAEIRQTAILRDNLDKPADAGLASLYAEINTKHFAGALPAMPVRWEPRLAEIGALAGRSFTLEGMFGRVGSGTVILLHPNLLPDIDALERALSHEMVHARLFFLGDTTTDHGPAFRAELKRLADEGAFAGIASTDDERAQLRAWLDAETIRIKSEREALAARA